MQISYQDWSDFLLRVGAVCSPAELHGLLCGIQCRGATEGWLADTRNYIDLLEEADSAAVDAALEAQFELIGAALTDGQYHLQLLLPDDMLPVGARAEALALWCLGFLHGFATADVNVVERLDAETREALRDLAEIARLDDACADTEECEQDLMELIEYARMTLFSVVSQLRAPVADLPSSTSLSPTRH